MAKLIAEPANENPGTEDWQLNLLKMTMTTGGLLMIGLGNMDNSSAPVIKAGSRFEINGSFYWCETDETVPGTPPANNAVNYVYAVPGQDPNQKTAGFEYGGAPSWQPDKGGWFNGANRAVVKFFYTSNQYNGKVILDSYNALYAINDRQSASTTGGLLVANGSVNTVTSFFLSRGAYRWEVKGGTGGAGGPSAGGSYAGGAGAQGHVQSGVFIKYDMEEIYCLVGGNGAPGGDADGGGGGGGCSGGSSFLDSNNDFILCIGGSGGGGATGYLGTGGGGGGGGGWGTGGAGISFLGGAGGAGGSTGTGGAGGAGGDGAGAGGAGSGYNGAGYGAAGAAGGSQTAGSIVAPGGAGGASAKGEGVVTALNKYDHRSQFQGGGGGGGHIGSGRLNGGAGGGSLLSSSDGYVRIYRMW
jgi:hypothetical protein